MSTAHRLPGFWTCRQTAGPPLSAGGAAEPRTSLIEGAYRRSLERPFRREERGRVTLIFGSLSAAHDRLLKATLQGLGYRADHLPMPGRRDFQTGREYCNPGQCNPVYFVTGALIRYLEHLRDEEGLSPDRIVSDYVFLTAGS
jgi:hypothetical protein